METCALHLAKLKPAISPNVGDSDAQFLVVGDCVRASPVINIQTHTKVLNVWNLHDDVCLLYSIIPCTTISPNTAMDLPSCGVYQIIDT